MHKFGVLVLSLFVSGCAASSAIPVGADTYMITASAAPACGGIGAQRVAFKTAAIETLRNGYDSFIIMSASAANNVRVVGSTPVYATTTSSYPGTYRTTFHGGEPIISGSHDQGFMVRMFRDGEPGASRAVSARTALGPDWEEQVAKGPPNTCL